jgi:hypothetical protein
MPINFGQADYYSPQIEIVGKEVPLAAMEKTGNVLQDRFDKSYENETKTEALMKKAIMDADEIDRPMAQKAYETYQQRLKDRASKGDYHNMRWETIRDAQDFANIYTGLSEKAKKMQQYRDAITTYKGIADPKRKRFELKRWAEAQNAINFDPENRQLTGLGVNAPQLVDDYNFTKFYDTHGKGFEADLTKRLGENTAKYNAGDVMLNGQKAPVTGFYDTKKGTQISEIKGETISQVLQAYLKGDPDAQAYLNSLAEYYTKDLNMSLDEAKAKIDSDLITGLADATGTKYGFRRTEDIRSSTLDAAATANFGLGVPPPVGNIYSPSDIFQTYKNQNADFKQLTFGALEGNKANKSMVLGTLDAMSNVNPKAKEAKDAVRSLLEFTEKYPEYANNLSKVTAGQTNLPILGPAQGLYNVLNMGYKLISDAVDGKSTEQMKKDFMKVKDKYHKIASADFIDSEFEDQFQQFSKSTPMTRTLPLKEFDIANDATRNLLDNLAKKYTKNDFDVIEGDKSVWTGEKNKNLEFLRWTDEPYGAGTGMVLEVKDGNGNAFIVQPKKQSLDALTGQIQKATPGSNVKRTYTYKDIIPVSYEGASKSFADFAEETDNPIVKNTLLRSKDFTIKLIDGQYQLFGPNETTPRLSSTSMYDLLPQF